MTPEIQSLIHDLETCGRTLGRQAARELRQIDREVFAARNLASLSCDLIEEWKRKHAESEAKLWAIKSRWTCGDCKVACTPENENEKCDRAHRDSWPHDWQSPETRNATLVSCGHLITIKKLEQEIERLKRLKSAAKVYSESIGVAFDDLMASDQIFLEDQS